MLARQLEFLADFGDLAVIGPAFIAAAAALVLLRRSREALAWGLAIAACVAVTLALKLLLGRFHLLLFGRIIHAASFPSGHAGISFVFYNGLAVLIWRSSRSRLLGALAGLLVALQIAIAVAVLMIGWHPLLDIAAGLCLGAACLGVALRCLDIGAPGGGRAMVGAVVASAAIVAVMHGVRLDDQHASIGLCRISGLCGQGYAGATTHPKPG